MKRRFFWILFFTASAISMGAEVARTEPVDYGKDTKNCIAKFSDEQLCRELSLLESNRNLNGVETTTIATDTTEKSE